MKNLLVLVKTICVLIIYIMGIQTNAKAQPTPGFSVFEMTYGGGQANHIIPASNAENANYITVGKVGGDGYLQNTNTNGALIWGKKIVAEGIDVLNSAVQTLDGGYAVVGTSYSIPNCITGIYVAKFDANCNLTWQKGYRDDHTGSNSASEGNAIENTGDGGLLVCGRTSGFNSEGGAFILKVDSVGNIHWAKVLNKYSRIYSMERTFDGGYILGGECSAPSGGMLLLKLDTTAENILFSKSYGAGGAETGFCVRQTTDNGFIVAGYGSYSENQFSSDINIFVVKTDQNGDTMWTKIIGDSLRRRACAVTEVADGYILAGVSGLSSGYGSNASIVKLDKDGNVLWQSFSEEGGAAIDVNYSIITTSNGFMVAGTQSYGFSIVKTDFNGSNSCNEDGLITSIPAPTIVSDVVFTEQFVNPITENVNFLVVDYSHVDTLCYSIITSVGSETIGPPTETKIFPNPVTNHFMVMNAEKLTLSLFNSFGALVLQKKLENNEEVLNLDLPNGIYLYSLGEKSGKIIVSK